MVSTPGTTPLEKADSLSQQASAVTALQLGTGAPEPQPSERDGDWIDLVWVVRRQPQLLWFHTSTGPVVSKRYGFADILPDSCLPFFDGS